MGHQLSPRICQPFFLMGVTPLRALFLPNQLQILLVLVLFSISFFFPSSALSELYSSFSSSSSSHTYTQVPYSKHCNHIVPESGQTDLYLFDHSFLDLTNAYVSGGNQILGLPGSQISASLWRQSIYRTQNPDVFKIDGTLFLTAFRTFSNSTNRRLFRVYGGNQFARFKRRLEFHLWGYWSSSSGQLCMVGSWNKKPLISGKDLIYDVSFKLNYPNNSNIYTGLLRGTLESLASDGSDGYFKPISILGFSRMNYDYSLVKRDVGILKTDDDSFVASFDAVYGKASQCANFITLSGNFRLEYSSSCGDHNCKLLDGIVGFLPDFMGLVPLECFSKPLTRVLVVFSNTSIPHNGFREPFNPHNTLVAEGAWDENRNQLSLVACRIILEYSNASVEDCSIRLNFTLLSVLSIRSRSLVHGQLWSNKDSSELGYFDRVGIMASELKRRALPNMTYEYTEIERASRYCAENKATTSKFKKGNYPSAYSSNMKFTMFVKNNRRQIVRGIAVPLFVNDYVVQDASHTSGVRNSVFSMNPVAPQIGSSNDMINMSYSIRFKPSPELKFGGKSFSRTGVEISAEGMYDTKTGLLCMAGCWNRQPDGEILYSNSSKEFDCEIFIRIQFPEKSVGVPKGTIESKRQPSDPLYFEKLELFANSMSEVQVATTVWRMDLEIIMVLVSNTLACIFLCLQLFHVKKHPQTRPFISVTMLILLTLGHMIPLLLNFDAFLSNRKKQHVFYGNGEWLEVNEVVVRVITMFAFLLEVCLLHLTWSSRGGGREENRKLLWSSEKKVIYLCLPLFIVGALISWFVHPLESSYQRQFLPFHYHRRQNIISPWGNLKSYAGLVMDIFLLPQIIFNLLSDSKEKALAPAYYIGTTFVRLMPHAYDLFRSHSAGLKIDLWYIYANPKMNYYSTSWDIIVSVCGIVFMVLINLQQRFGGRMFFPVRLRKGGEYEKVPVIVDIEK